MSSLLNEPVFRVPGLSKRALEQVAAHVRSELLSLSPDGRGGIDWCDLVERKIERLGISYYPADDVELPDCEGATDPSGTSEITILIRRNLYDRLGDTSRGGNRARSTIVHELGHALLHVPHVRRMRRLGQHDELRLHLRSQIKPWQDPEWQAWALAGNILAPRTSLIRMSGAGLGELADAHGVSEGLMKSHLKRLGMEVPQTE